MDPGAVLAATVIHRCSEVDWCKTAVLKGLLLKTFIMPKCTVRQEIQCRLRSGSEKMLLLLH